MAGHTDHFLRFCAMSSVVVARNTCYKYYSRSLLCMTILFRPKPAKSNEMTASLRFD